MSNQNFKTCLIFQMCGIHCGFDRFFRGRFYSNNAMDGCIYCSQKRWLVLLSILFILECYFNVTLRYDVPRNADVRNLYLNTTENTSSNKIKNESLVYYKYLLTNSVEVSMGEYFNLLFCF